MSLLPPRRATVGARLTHRKRWKVVMEHERLGNLFGAFDVVDSLLVSRRPEGRDNQRLRLTPRKER